MHSGHHDVWLGAHASRDPSYRIINPYQPRCVVRLMRQLLVFLIILAIPRCTRKRCSRKKSEFSKREYLAHCVRHIRWTERRLRSVVSVHTTSFADRERVCWCLRRCLGGTDPTNSFESLLNDNGCWDPEADACIFRPRVQVQDNWGYCTNAIGKTCTSGVGGNACYDNTGGSPNTNECLLDNAWVPFAGRIVVAPP